MINHRPKPFNCVALLWFYASKVNNHSHLKQGYRWLWR